MKELSNLEPKLIWQIFEDITKVPRPSKKEEKIIAWLLDFAKKHNLNAKKDKAGNVLISKQASPGMENCKTVVLQSHVDMVCEKNSDIKHDFDNDPIIPYIDGEWVKAKGTTLGADDGIGMAAALAVLTDNNIKHGPIEALFTVDEETGLSGAFALKPNFIKGNILINLDSEDEGEIFIGCAGGKDTTAIFKYEKNKVKKHNLACTIKVSGLRGGHSGDDIHKGYGNSIKIISRFLWEAMMKFDIKLHNIDGGNLKNAIPREATATFVIHSNLFPKLKRFYKKFELIIKNEFSVNEPNLSISIEETSLPKYIIDNESQFCLLASLYACPHGVIAWSAAIPNLVETSTNLASVKMDNNNKIVVATSQRSSVSSSINDIVNMVQSVFLLAGAKTKVSEGYPGWEPNINSEILSIAKSSYKKLFRKEPVVRAIHAGLECGLFLEKYPKLDMISIGPTLRGVHSPDEKLKIDTVKLFWEHLTYILELIPKEEK